MHAIEQLLSYGIIKFNMIKYLTNQKYRLKRQEFADMEMIGEDFQLFRQEKIRKYIRSLSHLKTNQQFKGCFSLIQELSQKKCPFQILKILYFYHLIIQEVSEFCEETLTEQVNKIIKTIDKNEKVIKERGRSKSMDKRSSSVQKTLHWLKTKVGNSKQDLRVKRAISVKQDQDNNIFTKQEFLMAKIVRPYIVYLTKSIALFAFYEKCKTAKVLQIHEVWIIIRILKNMLVISNSFSQAGRYYKSQFMSIVLALKRILSYEINFLYPLLKASIEKQALKIEVMYMQERNKKKDQQIVQVLVKDYKLREIIELLEETSKLNEDIQFLYFSKYFYEEAKKSNCAPHLLSTSTQKFDLLYQLHKLQKKGDENKTATNPFVNRSMKERVSKGQQNRSSFRQHRQNVIHNNLNGRNKLKL